MRVSYEASIEDAEVEYLRSRDRRTSVSTGVRMLLLSRCGRKEKESWWRELGEFNAARKLTAATTTTSEDWLLHSRYPPQP